MYSIMNVCIVSAFANCRPEDKTLLICAETNDKLVLDKCNKEN